MADITKCSGINCPVKDQCYRHTAPDSERQSWFVDIPGKYIEINGKQYWECNLFWGEQQDAIMDTLNTIFNGIQDDKI